MYKIFQSDILDWVKNYEGEKFHAVFCDPPYHLTSIVKRFGRDSMDNDTLTADKVRNGVDGYSRLIRTGFMNQTWDGGDIALDSETWEAISSVLYPGAYLLAFGGTRTWHRLACAIEDGGFDIFDTIMYVYGSGFPKSHNISKQLDRKAGAERTETVGKRHRNVKPYDDENGWNDNNTTGDYEYTAPATDLAKTWDGYGTALKPAFEPVILARKPVEKTIAENCAKYGSGGLNIDGCRVGVSGGGTECNNRDASGHCLGHPNANTSLGGGVMRHADIEIIPINKLEEWSGFGQKERPDYVQEINTKGRWPANLIHDGSEEVVDLFPRSAGAFAPVKRGHSGKSNGIYNDYAQKGDDGESFRGDSGSAARFFYTAKVSPSERNAGLDEYEDQIYAQSGGAPARLRQGDEEYKQDSLGMNRIRKVKNNHPTLKPIALTEYLAKLILPPSTYAPRRLLVPFSGAGSEMIGACKAGWEEVIGVELMQNYVEIAEARLKYWTQQPQQLEFMETK